MVPIVGPSVGGFRSGLCIVRAVTWSGCRRLCISVENLGIGRIEGSRADPASDNKAAAASAALGPLRRNRRERCCAETQMW